LSEFIDKMINESNWNYQPYEGRSSLPKYVQNLGRFSSFWGGLSFSEVINPVNDFGIPIKDAEPSQKYTYRKINQFKETLENAIKDEENSISEIGNKMIEIEFGYYALKFFSRKKVKVKVPLKHIEVKVPDNGPPYILEKNNGEFGYKVKNANLTPIVSEKQCYDIYRERKNMEDEIEKMEIINNILEVFSDEFYPDEDYLSVINENSEILKSIGIKDEWLGL